MELKVHVFKAAVPCSAPFVCAARHHTGAAFRLALPRLEAHLLDDSWQTFQADNVRQITVGNSTDALVRVAPRHWRTCHVGPQFPRPHENSMQWSIGADDALSSSATRRDLATSDSTSSSATLNRPGIYRWSVLWETTPSRAT